MTFFQRFAVVGALVLFCANSRADDTAALQSRLAENQGVLQLEKGTYRISKPLKIDLNEIGPISITGDGTARIVMIGPGPAIHLVGTHEGTAAPRTVKPEIWENQRGPVISGIEIVGEHPESEGILAEGTMQLRISGVTIRRTRNAIRLAKRNRNVIISNCNLYENRGIGLYLDDVNLHQINVVGCHISYNGGGGVVTRAGAVRNLHITGCDIEGNMSEEGPPTANVLIDSRESSGGTAEVAITGCTIQHTRKGPDSANIRIFGGAQPIGGIKHPRIGHVTITGNILSDAHKNIHLDNCQGITVTGNTGWQAEDHNLLVVDCTALVVGPNAFDRNPYYNRSGAAKSARNAVEFVGCEDCTIQGLHITEVHGGPAGMLVKDCRRMNITGCTILDCDGPELMLTGCQSCQVSGCLLSDKREDAEESELVVKGGEDNVVPSP